MSRLAWLGQALAAFALATGPAGAHALQEAPPPAGAVAAEAFTDLPGWYEVTLTVPQTSCRVKDNVGGEWRAVVEATPGRRGNLVLHLEQLKSWFTQPAPIVVASDGTFRFQGIVPVNLGAVTARANFELDGRVAEDRQSFQGTFKVKHQFCSFDGSLSGKRTSAPPPPAPTEPTGGASIFTDGSTAPAPGQAQPKGGASIFTDGYLPPSPDGSKLGPSPLINGSYATRLTVTESRCLRQDLLGSWQRDLELKSQPGILIPLNEYNSIFGGAVMLQVQGLQLWQSTTIPVRIGPVTQVPATFEGAFTPDGARFDVRFRAGNAFCRLAGTISGVRN